MSDRLSDQRIGELADRLALPEPGPAAGAALAAAVAMSAALVTRAARASSDWAEAPGAAAQSCGLRARALDLADEAAIAYAGAVAALRARGRDRRLAEALDRSARAPLDIGRTGADVAQLAAHAATHVDHDVRPDVIAAAALAAGAARASAELVAVNLGMTRDDGRLREARAASEIAEDAAARALRAAG